MNTIARSPSYLHRNPYSYCFRMRIPLDLQPVFQRKEFKVSLRTGALGVARTKARLLAGLVQWLFNHTRGVNGFMNLDADKVSEILEAFKAMALDQASDALRELYDTSTEVTNAYSQILRYIAHSKVSLIADDFSTVSDTLGHILVGHGIDVNENSPHYKALCRDALRLTVSHFKSEREKFAQEHPELDLDKLFDRNQIPAGQSEPEPKSDTFAQAVKDYWDEFSHTWKPRTRTDYKSALEHMLEELGPDTPVHLIDYERMKAFRDKLWKVEGKGGEPNAISTVNTYLTVAGKLFKLAMKKPRNGIAINPVDGLRIEDKRRPDEKQDIFEKEELQKLFDSREYRKDKHVKPHYFWIPILALFTGARRDEICQLHLTDVYELKGLWCIDINEYDPDTKSVKTGERRIIPIHPFITEELNFINYVKSIPSKQIRVFPLLKRVNSAWGHSITKWFTKYRNRCGVFAPPKKKTFHSLRHTLIDYLKQNDVPEKYAKEYVGHTNNSITYGTYGKQYDPRKLYDNLVSKIDFGLDLTHLKASKYVIK